ncbi:MAG TPA: hypothetical protein VN957_28350 [Chthoniobacterales bacterium]|nr:hypothetical protein [Chthoniobacterales bacterium]
MVPADSTQYIFVFDASTGKPVKKQVIRVPNTFAGIAFNPNGSSFYVGGGSDDNIHTYGIQGDGSWAEAGTPIALGHTTGNGLLNPPVIASTFVTGSLAVTADGTKIVIANVYNVGGLGDVETLQTIQTRQDRFRIAASDSSHF